MTDHPPAELLVCVKCRRGLAVPDDAARPGAVLFAALAAEAPDLRVVAVECLSNCDRGCSIALRGPGRWTFVYGDLDERTDIAAVLDGARRYAAAPDGLVPWRQRPEHFRKHCIARIPPLEAPHG